MPRFIPGLKLSELFYKEVVKPVLEAEFPSLKYSAGLIGSGSEVLGFDTPQSIDHHWGPRVLLFLSEDDYEEKKERIWRVLSEKLPYEFRGYPTNFGKPDEFGVQLLEKIESGPVNHRIDIFTIKSFFRERLGFDPYKEIKISDWLNFPEHELIMIVKGKVFHDDLGLKKIRKKFQYYPRDLWLYLLAAQWHDISQEEAFVGRCGDVGDELGSKIIATRIVERLMRLCFLMEKEYAPYSKWLGSAFSRLKSSKKLKPILNKILAAETWREREQHLSKAYEKIAKMHNRLDITKPMKIEVSRFYNRPYHVIRANDFAGEIRKTIENPEVREL
jgi:hypothetical protein